MTETQMGHPAHPGPARTAPAPQEPEMERRMVTSPARGAKVCLLLAVISLVGVAYFLFAPVQVQAGNSNAFYCGTAVSGPSTQFAKGICGKANSAALVKAGAMAGEALVLAAGGFLVFGTVQREQLRRRRPEADDDDEGARA